jgi:hypothetical protein
VRQQRIRRFLNFLGQGAEVLPLPHPRPHRHVRRLTGFVVCFGLGIGALLLIVYIVRYGMINPWILWNRALEAAESVSDSQLRAR